MFNLSFIKFVFLLINRHKSKHLSIFIILTILVWLFSSVIFISFSLQNKEKKDILNSADMFITKSKASREVETPVEWIDDLLEIEGVDEVIEEVNGFYIDRITGKKIKIIGIDIFNTQLSSQLKSITKEINIDLFSSKNNMIISHDLKEYFKTNFYTDSYVFYTPNLQSIKVYFYQVKNLHNTIILPIELAKSILGIKENMATSIAISIPNTLEIETIRAKIIKKYYNVQIVSKEQKIQALIDKYNYKTGIFISLFIVVLTTFMLILFQRYSMINSSDKKEIGILKAVGWSINNILLLKIFESLIIGIFAFLLGLVFAYIYVYNLNAPILIDIFIRSFDISNLTLVPNIEYSLFVTIFIFFLIPYIASILIPVWRLATTDIVEVLR